MTNLISKIGRYCIYRSKSVYAVTDALEVPPGGVRYYKEHEALRAAEEDAKILASEEEWSSDDLER